MKKSSESETTRPKILIFGVASPSGPFVQIMPKGPNGPNARATCFT